MRETHRIPDWNEASGSGEGGHLGKSVASASDAGPAAGTSGG